MFEKSWIGRGVFDDFSEWGRDQSRLHKLFRVEIVEFNSTLNLGELLKTGEKLKRCRFIRELRFVHFYCFQNVAKVKFKISIKIILWYVPVFFVLESVLIFYLSFISRVRENNRASESRVVSKFSLLAYDKVSLGKKIMQHRFDY